MSWRLGGGFRPISLSASGPPGDARYAAVWVQRPGPAWIAVHNLDANQYQARFNELTGQGFAPILVTATGGYNDATFAAVFEAGVTSPWYARHQLWWDPSAGINSVKFENQRAFDQGYIPRCLAVYGTPSDALFAGVWVKNDKPVPWDGGGQIRPPISTSSTQRSKLARICPTWRLRQANEYCPSSAMSLSGNGGLEMA
ncbi:MAG: hypothetical protein ACRERU_19555 [Methylococcales bacterium]